MSVADDETFINRVLEDAGVRVSLRATAKVRLTWRPDPDRAATIAVEGGATVTGAYNEGIGTMNDTAISAAAAEAWAAAESAGLVLGMAVDMATTCQTQFRPPEGGGSVPVVRS